MSSESDIADAGVKELVFVGSPLLDITTTCDRTTLEEYDLPEDGCIRATPRHDPLFERLFSDPSSRLDAGGSALNSAKIAKWVLGHIGQVSFAGCTGEDSFSSYLRRDLLAWGVRPLLVALPDHGTGVCACLLGSGAKRSMCTRLGAAALFSRLHLQKADVRENVNRADCTFIVGYFLAHSPDVVLELADTCSTDQLFSLSLSAEYICREYSELLLRLLPRVDVLLGNEAEVKALATALGLQRDITTSDDGVCTLTEEACALAKIGRHANSTPRIVVVTRGPDPVIVVEGHNPPRLFPVPRDVVVLDSVGCGDALAGAFLAIYVLTKDIHRSIEAGIRAAVEIAKVPGCNPPPQEFGKCLLNIH